MLYLTHDDLILHLSLRDFWELVYPRLLSTWSHRHSLLAVSFEQLLLRAGVGCRAFVPAEEQAPVLQAETSQSAVPACCRESAFLLTFHLELLLFNRDSVQPF